MVTVEAPTAVTDPLRGRPGDVVAGVPEGGALVAEPLAVDPLGVEPLVVEPLVVEPLVVAVAAVAGLAVRPLARMPPPPAKALSMRPTASPLLTRRRPWGGLVLLVFIGLLLCRASPGG